MKLFQFKSNYNQEITMIKAETEDRAIELFKDSIHGLAEEYADTECEDEESTREENIESFKDFRTEEQEITELTRDEKVAIAINWLESNQMSGAFEGQPEDKMNFRDLEYTSLLWYFDNWVMADTDYIEMLEV